MLNSYPGTFTNLISLCFFHSMLCLGEQNWGTLASKSHSYLNISSPNCSFTIFYDSHSIYAIHLQSLFFHFYSNSFNTFVFNQLHFSGGALFSLRPPVPKQFVFVSFKIVLHFFLSLLISIILDTIKKWSILYLDLSSS